MDDAQRDYLTVKDLPHVLPVTESTARWWVFSNTDGFADRCVIRRGRRVFIDRAALSRWLADGRASTA